MDLQMRKPQEVTEQHEMEEKEQQELVGRNLRKYRISAQLTQKQLAQRAGISASYYSSLERGKKSMSVWVLYSLAEALNVNVGSLLYEESPQTQIGLICHWLQSKPASFLAAAEKIIHCFNEQFSHADIPEIPPPKENDPSFDHEGFSKTRK